MNDYKTEPPYIRIERRTPRTEPDAPALEAGKGTVPVVYRSGGRHSAITDTLYSLHRYKRWAEKMKRDFEEKP